MHKFKIVLWTWQGLMVRMLPYWIIVIVFLISDKLFASLVTGAFNILLMCLVFTLPDVDTKCCCTVENGKIIVKDLYSEYVIHLSDISSIKSEESRFFIGFHGFNSRLGAKTAVIVTDDMTYRICVRECEEFIRLIRALSGVKN